MMKNEAPFILEWIAYHRVIGFKKFIIFSNDSDDGTTEILDRLHHANEIQHIYHELEDHDVLDELLPRLVANLKPYDVGDWVIWLDADEFLNIHIGDGQVSTLISQILPAQGMTICWRVFGDSGQKKFNGRFISEKFTHCAKPGQSWQNVKTLFKFDEQFESHFNHKPIMTDMFWEKGGEFVNPSGKTLSKNNKLARIWISGKKRGKIDEQECSWTMAQINHYAVRTEPLFRIKAARGSAGENQVSENNRYSKRYYRGLNLNGAEDRSILRWADLVALEIARLLQDSGLSSDYKSILEKSYHQDVFDVKI